MIHSMMDDNVHPQNTMQLFTAFTNAGKDVEARIYPPGRHGAIYNMQSMLLVNRGGVRLPHALGGSIRRRRSP